LKRLKTDYIDVYHMHGFDALTPPEETFATLDEAVRQGKLRYIAASNFSGWYLQMSLAVSAEYGWARYVGHQVYYSLVGRDYEWALMPQALSEGIGALVWSAWLGPPHREDSPRPACAGREPPPQDSRTRAPGAG
jgi:aryl-alcohol dehydrogenase-like predicted oxidoreductase